MAIKRSPRASSGTQKRSGSVSASAPVSVSAPLKVDFVDFTARSRHGAAPQAFLVLLGLPAPGSAESTESAGAPAPAPELWQRVEQGFSYGSFEHFQRNIGLPVKEVVGLLQIPHSTLVRRKKAGQLGPLESDRLVRFGRLLGLAVELFEGDSEAAREWLRSPQRALGGESPLQMARTEVGAREVEQLIGRLEHGVFS